jgi:hypothetical protein
MLKNTDSDVTPSTAPIFEVRLNQNFVENLPRKNTTITTFHAVSKGGTGHFTDFPNFCYRGCFFVSCHSNLHGNERGGTPGGAVHMHDSEKARN